MHEAIWIKQEHLIKALWLSVILCVFLIISKNVLKKTFIKDWVLNDP